MKQAILAEMKVLPELDPEYEVARRIDFIKARLQQAQATVASALAIATAQERLATAGPSYPVALERARATLLEAYGNQDVPFERLVSELSPRRDTSVTPLFQSMFSLDSSVGSERSLFGGEASALRGEIAYEKFDVSLAEAQDLVMTARVMLGWVDPEELVGDSAEETETEESEAEE